MADPTLVELLDSLCARLAATGDSTAWNLADDARAVAREQERELEQRDGRIAEFERDPVIAGRIEVMRIAAARKTR